MKRTVLRHSLLKSSLTLKLLGIIQGHWKWLHSIDRIWLPFNFE